MLEELLNLKTEAEKEILYANAKIEVVEKLLAKMQAVKETVSVDVEETVSEDVELDSI